MVGKRTVNKQSLPEIIANDLRERILSGELGEGEAIRQEALATEYDVSRMPIREALKRLSAEGLVDWANNRGGTVIRHSIDQIGEIFDLRELLEVDLFRRAIPNMTPADFSRCEELMQKMEASYDGDDVGQWGELNYDYHAALYAASNRDLTRELLNRIGLQSDRYIRMHLSIMKQREPAKDEHRQLLAYAKAGDIENACSLLERHIRRTRDELLEMVTARRSQEGK
ncbi:GntR family transcriptional regulator [Halocynthiibacter namhaensis]|uniref:GntR family transcriptional regulator n=1 Tax=Halocynthiibacter namhaensis TaxID=1290553 RepID=UPI00057982B9|nr:GntR family transcriptional regulator [Halocynthiibacter namhaensis]